MMLKFHRIVKGTVGFQGVLALLRQSRTLHEPLERAPRFVVDLDFFGAYPGFTLELLGRHEEVQERGQMSIQDGQEGLFLKARKPVIAHIFPDDGAVFLFNEAVIVFLMVAAAGEGDLFFGTPEVGGMVDKLRAVIAVELQNGERDGGFDIREGLESPGMGVIEEGTEFCPAGSDTAAAVRVWT
jgi:hypothetical protein